ncbi:MAG: hypothetical protein E7637_01910 [Ruminococcaceae bacterium]|nr:hypothetical protein [Oscillospiraceae bacterium]
MAFHGTVRNFGTYTDHQILQTKQDLSLQMSPTKLRACAAYFHNELRRDPYIEELRFLDAFCSEETPSPLSIAPTELYTNDSFVAETYADMMQKRRALSPDATHPCTFSEAFGLMGNYLDRSGKKVTTPVETYFFEDCKAIPGLTESEDILSISNARYGLRQTCQRKLPYEDSDLFILLAPAAQLSHGEQAIELNRFLSNEEIVSHIKKLRSVGNRGVLFELLQMTDGVAIDLNRFSRTEEPLPLSSLIKLHIGNYLVRISDSYFEEFEKVAKKHSLFTLRFARVYASGFISVGYGNEQPLVWSNSFIRSLFDLQSVSVYLKKEEGAALSAIEHIPHRVGSSPYVIEKNPLATPTVLTHKNSVYTAAFSSPQEAFFRNALDTALATVITLAANGIPYSKQLLAVNLNLPEPITDPTTVAASASAILGLYRLQAELGIPLSTGKLSSDPEINSPEITVFSTGTGNTVLPNVFSTANNRVYCVAPEFHENGLPNFDKLRVFLDWLTNLAERKVLMSVRVLCRKTVTDGILEMNSEHYACAMNGTSLFDMKERPFAVLLESRVELNVRCVGITKERVIEADSTPHETLPKNNCLIYAERPHIVIYAASNDRGAQALAILLTQKGAFVSVFSPISVPYRFAEALLDAQTFIACGQVDYPTSPYVSFALETLSRADGRLLFLGGAKKPTAVKGFVLPNGISEEIVDQICKI